MGLFHYFKRRRERESAIPAHELHAEGAPAPAPPADEPVGRMLPGVESQPINLNLGSGQPDLGQVLGMITQAFKTGNVQVAQTEAQTIDLQGSGLREQILEAMRQRGIDPDASCGAEVNAADYAGLQADIMRALADHGLDLGAGARPPGDQTTDGSGPG